MQENLDIKDKHGNVVIQPGLKVRHKDSQYEYTVDDVIKTPEGDVSVVLRMPEDPRFEPPEEEEVVISDAKSRAPRIYEISAHTTEYFIPDEVGESEDEEEFLEVPQKEFEKDYEVK